MLHLGQTFTRAQLADMMAMASRWGAEAAYERGLHDGQRRAEDEMTAVALATIERVVTRPVFSEREHRAEAYRARARREADAAAGVPWHGDHPGGPVALAEDGGWAA
jgi:hypothetical protein